MAVIPTYDPARWEAMKKDFPVYDNNVNWDWEHRQVLLDWLLDLNPEKLLDVGCLRAHYLGELRRRGWTGHYTGADVTISFLQDAKKEFPGDSFVQSNAMTIADSGMKVDVLLCSELLQHLPDPAVAADQFAQVATRAIVLSVQGCDHPHDTKEWEDMGFIDRAFSRQDAVGFCPDGWIMQEFKISKHPRHADRLYYQMIYTPALES